jgi:hypothetical protein
VLLRDLQHLYEAKQEVLAPFVEGLRFRGRVRIRVVREGLVDNDVVCSCAGCADAIDRHA